MGRLGNSTPSITKFLTTVGITASTTQTQGQQPLVTSYNQVSVVANDNDVVTLPPAIAGSICIVSNDGANDLQIFPASGDNASAGVNISIILESNERVELISNDSTTWDIESSTQVPHAEMHDVGNTDVFVISAQAEEHGYHTNGLVAGDLLGWTFDAGGGGTSFPIASIADGAASGVDIKVTTTGSHLLAVGDIVSQSNLADAAYVGMFAVKAIISATEYEVAAVFTATGTGTMNQAATLNVIAGSEGKYLVVWSASASPATNNEEFDFDIHQNAVEVTGAKARNTFGTNTDFQTVSGVAVLDIVTGDKILFDMENVDSAANITVREFTLALHRL